MKIVFLSTFYPFRGGIAQFSAHLYREAEKKHDVEAVTFTRQYPKLLFPGKTQLVSADDTADKIPAKRWLDSINPFTYISTARKIKNLQPDLIISRYWMSFFAPSFGWILGKQDKKTIRLAILDNVIPHERRFFDDAFNRFFLSRNDGFIVMSEQVQKDLLFYLPKAKHLLIPHPIYNHFGSKISKSEALKKLSISECIDKKVLLFFGIIRDYKGLDILLYTLQLLDDSYILIVAGEVYGSFEKYENIIKEKKLEKKVKLYNRYIDDAEVTNYFSAADVCVLPYRSATQSGITNISYHFEVPVISTNVGGLAETISHGRTGLITEEVNEKALLKQIKNFYEVYNPKEFAQNIQHYNKENSWENFVSKMLDFSTQLK
ncbi:MAG: glycosyltransferase [Flavobacteriales bacterium]|nr:glycosyltransferase [Flavobacteriales bacterium]